MLIEETLFSGILVEFLVRKLVVDMKEFFIDLALKVNVEHNVTSMDFVLANYYGDAGMNLSLGKEIRSYDRDEFTDSHYLARILSLDEF